MTATYFHVFKLLISPPWDRVFEAHSEAASFPDGISGAQVKKSPEDVESPQGPCQL